MKTYLKIILILFLIFSCENVFKKQNNKSQTIYSKFEKICLVLGLNSGFINYTEIKDLANGFLSINNFSEFKGNPICPMFPASKRINFQYYIKKCLQGQIFRQVENDCKGKGTISNFFSAEKFQRCPTNTRCFKSEDLTLLSCAETTFANVGFFPISFQNNDLDDLRLFFQKFPDQIPSGNTDFYWSENYESPTNLFKKNQTDFNFVTLNYLICGTKKIGG